MFLENPEIGGTRLIQTIFHAIVSSSSVVPFVRLKYVTLLQYTLLTHLVRRFFPLGYEPWVFERVQGLNCDSPGNNIASLTPSTLPCSLVPDQIQPYLSLSLRLRIPRNHQPLPPQYQRYRRRGISHRTCLPCSGPKVARPTPGRRQILCVGRPNAKYVRLLWSTRYRRRENHQAVTWRCRRSHLEEDQCSSMNVHDSMHRQQPCDGTSCIYVTRRESGTLLAEYS